MSERSRLATAALVVAMALVGATFLYPFFYLLVNSLKTTPEYMLSQFSMPSGAAGYSTYDTMFSAFKILRYLKNTFIVMSTTVAAVIPVAICSAYTLAKLRFRGSTLVYLLLVACMTLPDQVMIVPIYSLFGRFQLINTHLGLILANLSYVFGSTVMMTSFFRTIPNELIEAAKVDGCGYLRTVRHVALTVGKPVVIIQMILSAIASWNDLFMPKMLLQKNSVKTIMVALADLSTRYTTKPPYLMAGLLISAVPTVVVFLLFQRQIINGILLGSIKG